MSIRIVATAIAALSLAASLGACAGPEPDGINVASSLNDSSLNEKCAALASTGDMYRYCLQEGPEQAALVSHPSREIAASVR